MKDKERFDAVVRQHLMNRLALMDMAERHASLLRRQADAIMKALETADIANLVHATRLTDPALSAKLQVAHELSHLLDSMGP